MCIPFVVCHVPHVEALKLIIYLVVSLYHGITGLLLVHCFSVKKAVMPWSEPKSYKKPFVLLHSWDLGFRDQWCGYRNSFCQGRLLTVTLQPCSLPFNVQVMILAGSSGFINLACASVDGCYLYIIIHYGMS